MAENLSYGMGQLRYSGDESTYKTQINNVSDGNNFEAIKTQILKGSSDECYQDVILKLADSSSFVYNQPYLLHLEIPRDLIYSNRYYLKLIQIPQDDESIDTTGINFQLIKTILVPRAEAKQGQNSKVVLYPVDAEGKPWNPDSGTAQADVKVGIALYYSSESNYNNGDIIEYQEPGHTESSYYIWENDLTTSKNNKISTKVDTILEWTWLTGSERSHGVVNFDIVFTPRTNFYIYNGILIEMLRSNFDYDIYNSSKKVFGRFIDLDSKDEDENPRFKAKIYELKNLIGTDTGKLHNPLNYIGVYSHPNLIMAINGEEIRTGQSGYYELNDFEITSLAFYPVDEHDKFTLDYQWIKD